MKKRKRIGKTTPPPASPSEAWRVGPSPLPLGTAGGAKIKIRSKKGLGQNFLRDQRILQKIADFAHIGRGDTVLEVGPGEGTLTEILLSKGARVIAVEKDSALVEILKSKFEKEISAHKIEIICADILDFEHSEESSASEPCERDWREHEEFFSRKISVRESGSFLPSAGYKLIGNIPYYITGTIFKKFLENPPGGVQPKSITFVVQKEVAKRIVGQKGSILSISVKAFGDPEYGGEIKAGSFHPRPKVDSAIIAVRNISRDKFEKYGVKEVDFFNLLHAGFAHKRKFLISNLSKAAFDIEGLRRAFEKCEISEKVRAEDLSTEDWFSLATHLTPAFKL